MDSHKVSMESTTPEEDIRQLLRVTLNREGGDPSLLLELLARVVEMQIWKRFKMSFVEFIETPYDKGGVGWSRRDVETILKLTHRYEKPENVDSEIAERLAIMREAVREQLNRTVGQKKGEGAPIGNTNRNKNKINSDMSELKSLAGIGGNSLPGTIARLKGDGYNELAEQVIRGELSASRARQQAYGIRRRAINMNDPHSAAATIVKHMPKEQIDELISLLLEAIHQEN